MAHISSFQNDSSIPPLDRERLHLVADTLEEEQELLALFFRGAEDKIGIMEHSMVAATWSDWQRAAHYLKGSASNLGMQEFVERCHQAELSQPLPPEEAEALLKGIKVELQRIKSYVAS